MRVDVVRAARKLAGAGVCSAERALRFATIGDLDGDGALTEGEFCRVARMASALSEDQADRNLERMIEARLDGLG